MKLHNKTMNPTYNADKLVKYEEILNNETLSLLPDSLLYKKEEGEPAWEFVLGGAVWNTVKLPTVANPNLEIK